jgi:hypothetical protein
MLFSGAEKNRLAFLNAQKDAASFPIFFQGNTVG